MPPDSSSSAPAHLPTRKIPANSEFPNAPCRSVALLGLRTVSHFERLALGVDAFCRETGKLRIEENLPSPTPMLLDDPRDLLSLRLAAVDGVITSAMSPELATLLCGLKLPAVVVSARVPRCGFPAVLPDDEKIGVSAAEFFLQRGFTHFSFFGCGSYNFSVRRREAFRNKILQERGDVQSREAEVLWRVNSREDYVLQRAGFQEWLRSLPKPCGLFCANDFIASIAIREALAIEISVPEEVAILGVDNEPTEANFPAIALSSIPLDSIRQGVETAKLLDRMLEGEPPPSHPILIPPHSISMRASTEVACSDDPTVRRALGVMLARFREPLRISEVAKLCRVSRRLLELRFRERLQRSPREELERIRLEEAKRLLRQGKPLDEVAEFTGFSHAGLLIERFREMFGETPGRFRAREATTPAR